MASGDLVKFRSFLLVVYYLRYDQLQPGTTSCNLEEFPNRGRRNRFLKTAALLFRELIGSARLVIQRSGRNHMPLRPNRRVSWRSAEVICLLPVGQFLIRGQG